MRCPALPYLGSVSAYADLRAGAAVARCDARQPGARVAPVLLALQNGLGQGGHVHARVALARDEEGVAQVLGEQAEEGVDGPHVLGCRAVVVAGVVSAAAVAEAHPHWGLDVQHVHQQVPKRITSTTNRQTDRQTERQTDKRGLDGIVASSIGQGRAG